MGERGRETYRAAGVDVERGYESVRRIRRLSAPTHDERVLRGVGGFAALYRLAPFGGDGREGGASVTGDIGAPVLVAAADGVGTKALLAARLGRHEGIGVDLVAMNVNDIVAQGGRPLFFLDYIAMSRVEVETVEALVRGMADGCRQAGCALIGGETAEMPDVYAPGTYDVAGFAVGVLESGVLERPAVEVGDVLLGVASSGVHSNGFSLIRRIVDAYRVDLDAPLVGGTTLGEALLTPTAIYARSLGAVQRDPAVKAMAHITGGGFVENVPRALPENRRAVIRFGAWPVPDVFTWIREHPLPGHPPMTWAEMGEVFNLGIGMVVVVRPEAADRLRQKIAESGFGTYPIGEIVEGERGVDVVF